MARRNIAEVLTGAVVLLVAAGFLVYAVAHSGRSATGGYELYARFDHIGSLAVGADVRMAGVKVGSVDSATIDPKTYLAVVGFSVRKDIKLPKDSAAQIASDGLLGGNYLSLTPGGDDAILQPGQTVTITQSAVNIEELLGKFIFSASTLATSAKPAQSGGTSGAPGNAGGSPGGLGGTSGDAGGGSGSAGGSPGGLGGSSGSAGGSLDGGGKTP
jgi:phospholipid/cholesterol/gamma-HCH transport system substrate-binding protein